MVNAINTYPIISAEYTKMRTVITSVVGSATFPDQILEAVGVAALSAVVFHVFKLFKESLT